MRMRISGFVLTASSARAVASLYIWVLSRNIWTPEMYGPPRSKYFEIFGPPLKYLDRVRIHCKEGIVITTDSLLFQIQMSEHNSLLCGGELYDTLFLILSQLSSTLSYHLGN